MFTDGVAVEVILLYVSREIPRIEDLLRSDVESRYRGSMNVMTEAMTLPLTTDLSIAVSQYVVIPISASHGRDDSSIDSENIDDALIDSHNIFDLFSDKEKSSNMFSLFLPIPLDTVEQLFTLDAQDLLVGSCRPHISRRVDSESTHAALMRNVQICRTILVLVNNNQFSLFCATQGHSLSQNADCPDE